MQDLLSKGLNALIGVIATVGITVGGWALKSNYNAQLRIKEIEIRVMTLEKYDDSSSDTFQKNLLRIQQNEMSSQLLKSDIQVIKSDIKEIKEILKDKRQ